MSFYALAPYAIGIAVMFAIIGKMAYRKHKAQKLAKAAKSQMELR